MNFIDSCNNSKLYKRCRKKGDKLVDHDLQELSKDELISRIRGLEAHNVQLKNLLLKNNETHCTQNTAKGEGKKQKFDFSKVAKRHVFLKLYYIGWDYNGFTVQEDSANTIEHYLFKALYQCCLVEDRKTSNYHRCGRTDKGVSAFSQVISIDLRSRVDEPDDSNTASELPYCSMLNRLLPSYIRCYAWAHVGATTSARFDCTSRTYKYWFPKGDLDIEGMLAGATYLEGSHDFRNLCKMDVANGVTDFHRQIKSVHILPVLCSSAAASQGYEMYELTIVGSGFLWHQIRCIMSVLLLVGQRKEAADVVKALLDVEQNPRKPQYSLAAHLPLNLFHTDFQALRLRWVTSEQDLRDVIILLQGQWTEFAVKSTMVVTMIRELDAMRGASPEPVYGQPVRLQEGVEPKVYKPLFKRDLCDSLENKITHYVKKKKLIREDNPDTA